VNLGGEPERDDSGLPPVDIVVPDDARELERDVQAYRRELRALRRQQRRMRWHGPLTRDGVILPLLASCLVLAVIAGTLLTLMTARPGGEPAGPAPAVTRSSSAPTSSTPAATPPDTLQALPSPRRFPAQPDIRMGGTLLPRATLIRTVIALIPRGCGCAAQLAELVRQAGRANVIPYFVGGGSLASVQEVTALARQAKTHKGVALAQDAAGTLARTYLPGGTASGSGPTLLLVGPDGSVGVTEPLPADFQLGRQLTALAASSS
jgi:hypothetical protein